LGDLRKEFFNLDAAKLVYIDINQTLYIQHLLTTLSTGAQHRKFQQAKLSVINKKLPQPQAAFKKVKLRSLL
jgi:hypothetical protein